MAQTQRDETMTATWQSAKMHEMLAYFESALITHSAPDVAKELVFNASRKWKQEGYCSTVAFHMALSEYNFGWIK